MTKVLMDCDTGVDDTMAILYAALHPDIEIVGIGSVWGNVDAPVATRNSIHALEMCGLSHIPVAEGAHHPLVGKARAVAYHVHGRDGQGNRGTGRPVGPAAPGTAAEQIVRLCREQPGEIELVAVGPLTNLALALGLFPELPTLVRGVTIMGGAAMVPGNVSEVAEANIWHDAEAAAAVFDAPWPLTMVGLDVTMRTLIDESHLRRLAAGGTIGQYLARITDFYMQFFTDNDFSVRKSCLHDALAVAVATDTVRVDVAPVVRAKVDTSGGPSHGQTLCDLRGRFKGYPPQDGAHCRVVLECDWSFGDYMVELIAAAGDSAIDVSEPERSVR